MIIDQLPELTNTFDTDEIPIERGTNTYKTKISTFFSGVRDLIAAKVSKAGDTMTGILTFTGTGTTGINLKSPVKESGTVPSGEQSHPRVNFYDKNDYLLGWLSHGVTSAGREGMVLQARRLINGATKNVYLGLYLDSDGVERIVISSPTAWRTALGLGTSGALPITVAQGGTGQTNSSSTTVTSDIIASTGTGVTIAGVSFSQWGKMAMFDITVKLSTAVSTSADTTVFTLKSTKCPKTYAPAVARYTGVNHAYIATDGEMHLIGTLPANSNVHILATYILE